MSIRHKVYAVIALVVAGYALSIILFSYEANRAEKLSKNIRLTYYPATMLSLAAKAAFDQQVRAYEDAVTLGEPKLVDLAMEKLAVVDATLNKLTMSLPLLPEDKDYIEAISRRLHEYSEKADITYRLMASGKRVPVKVASELAEQSRGVQEMLVAISNRFSEKRQADLHTITNEAKRAQEVNAILFLVFILPAVFITALVLTKIVKRLNATVKKFQELLTAARVRGNVPAPLLIRSDEIDSLSVAVETMATDLADSFRRQESLIQELQNKQILLNAMLDNSFQFQGLLLPDGRVVQSNKAANDFAGISEEEVIGRYFWDTPWWSHDAIQQERLREAIMRASSGEFVRFEGTHSDAKGVLHDMDFSLKPVYGNTGTIEYLIPEGRDITENKQAQQERNMRLVRENREQAAIVALTQHPAVIQGEKEKAADVITAIAAEILNVDRVGIWMFDAGGDAMRCTSLYEKVVDRHTSGHVLHKSDYPHYFEALATSRVIAASDALTDPRTVEFREGYLMPQGITSMLDAPIRISGSMIGVICHEKCGLSRQWQADEISFAGQIADQFASAITNDDRRKAEESLRQEKLFSDAIIGSLPGVFYVCDAEGRLLRWNNNEKETTGYSIEELSHMNVLQLLQDDDREQAKLRLREVMEAGKSNMEVSLVTKSGVRIPFYLTGFRLIMNDRKYVVGIGIDISERKKLEAQLLHSQKMEAIGTLAGGIAHDFNNILSGIVGYAELAKMKVGMNGMLAEYLSQIMEGVQRAAELTKQILTFSRKTTQQKKPLQLAVIVKEALKLLRATVPTTIEIRQDVVTTARVMADPTQMHQVIMNLCTNAYQAMEEAGGTLAVSLKELKIDEGESDRLDGDVLPSGEYVVLEVSDTGYGMDELTKDRIFEPYFTTKKEGKGTGLGLAVVHGIVKSHQGRINVYSEKGKGTMFKVLLPMLNDNGKREEGASQAIPVGGKERILFVDDEEMIRLMAKDFLSSYGYRVDLASHGAEALAQFEKHQRDYDMLITDMTMPGMNGKDLALKIKEMRPELPVILCTGFSPNMNSAEATTLGIEYIEKPIVISELLIRIRKVLDR